MKKELVEEFKEGKIYLILENDEDKKEFVEFYISIGNYSSPSIYYYNEPIYNATYVKMEGKYWMMSDRNFFNLKEMKWKNFKNLKQDDNMKLNCKVRCIDDKCIDNEGRHHIKDKIYQIVDGTIHGENDWKSYHKYSTIEELNKNMESQFEEFKPDKINLLLEDGFELNTGDRTYRIDFYDLRIGLSISHNDGGSEHDIRWGKYYDTTFKDVKPLLDALNIEIIEPEKKYKIKTDKEYSEEETIKLKEIGIDFEEVKCIK